MSVGSFEFLTFSLLLASACAWTNSQPCDDENVFPCYLIRRQIEIEGRHRRISLVDVLRDPHYVTSMNEEAWEKALGQLKAYQELFGGDTFTDPQKKKRSVYRPRWSIQRQIVG